MADKLPIITFDKKSWFVDDKLREIRDVNSPHIKISFDDINYLHIAIS